MKVVCVFDGDYPGKPISAVELPNGHVVAGETYTVTRSFTCDDGRTAYVLAEKPIIKKGERTGWLAQRFVKAEYFADEFRVQAEMETLK